mgnify:CR=1 FL=1
MGVKMEFKVGVKVEVKMGVKWKKGIRWPWLFVVSLVRKPLSYAGECRMQK